MFDKGHAKNKSLCYHIKHESYNSPRLLYLNYSSQIQVLDMQLY